MPLKTIWYRICSSHCLSTMTFSVSSRSSSCGVAIIVTSISSAKFDVRAPTRTTVALRRYETEPNSALMVGGAVRGMGNEIG